MKYGYGYAACISTQAGCNMGCKFCASAIGGKDSNMTAGELLNEVYLMERDCGERIGHVVLMGSGEPLDNFDEVIRFIRLINSEKGYNLSQRRITLSTCGITDKIYELMEERLQITLAVSLHAPNDDIRKRTMPVAKKYPMKELVDACGAYAEETGRRVTFEYALIKGINDSPQCAGELGERLKNILCHVNLIPVNDVKGKDEVFTRSSDRDIKDFCVERGIAYLTTCDFLYYAWLRGKMSETEVVTFIENVKNKGSKLPDIDIRRYTPNTQM